MSELPVYNAEHSNPIVIKMIKLGKRRVALATLVSFNRLSPGCGTTPRTEKTVWCLCRLLNIIRVGLNNAATSRILVNNVVIPIL